MSWRIAFTVAAQLDVEPGDFFGTGHTGIAGHLPPHRRLVVGLRKRLGRAVSETIEGLRRAGRGTLAVKAATTFLVLAGDRLGREPSARAKAFLVQRVLASPIVFTDRFGLRYLLFPTDAVYESFLNDGYYERAEQNFCAGYVEPGMTVLDVGASQGFYTLLFASLAGPSECTPSSRRRGTSVACGPNLELNGFEAVHASRLAAVREPGEVALNVFPPELYGWHTLGTPSLEVDRKAGRARVAPAGSGSRTRRLLRRAWDRAHRPDEARCRGSRVRCAHRCGAAPPESAGFAACCSRSRRRWSRAWATSLSRSSTCSAASA